MRKAFFVLVLGLLLVSCTPKDDSSLSNAAFQKVMEVPHETTNIQARPDEETKLELSDGAKVLIPAGSAGNNVEVVLERNPDKAKTMPALGEYNVPVSSFYNIEPKGDGLVGPVEVQLPVDKSLIPEGMEGELVALFPDGKGGWRSETVNEVNGKAVLYTDELGDPIIAWHFGPYDEKLKEHPPVSLDEYINNKCDGTTLFNLGKKKCVDEEYQKFLDNFKKTVPVCESEMDMQAVIGEGDSGSTVEIYGRVANPVGKALHDIPKDYFAHLPVELKVNYKDVNIPPKTIQAETDMDGRFQVTLNYGNNDTGLKEGWNWVFASAICPGGKDNAESRSKGYVEFKLPPKDKTTDEPAPVVEFTQPPEGAVAVPDVVGLSLDEATKKLEELGFRTTWVNGKSSMELGQIYQQKPAAGEYFVPHRTTVVLFKTIEKNSVLRNDFYAEYSNVQKGWKSYGCEKIYIQTLDDTYESSNQVILKDISTSGELKFEQKFGEGESSSFSIKQNEQINGIYFTNPGKKSYQIPENRGTTSFNTGSSSTSSPSYELQLVANESILVMGKSIDTFVYEGKYTEITNGEMHYPDTNCTYVLTEENNIRYNIDPKSGLVLLMDLTYSTLSCSLNTGPCELDGFSGSIKTSLISTNHELGWEN